MPAFQIYLNGKKLTTAGVNNEGLLNAFVHWSRVEPKGMPARKSAKAVEELSLQVHGLIPRSGFDESLGACLKIPRDPVFGGKAGWQGSTKENILGGSSTEEQRSQPGFTAKTRRAPGLLSSADVGSVLTARSEDVSWPVRHGPALAHAKIPLRRASRNFQTGSLVGGSQPQAGR